MDEWRATSLPRALRAEEPGDLFREISQAPPPTSLCPSDRPAFPLSRGQFVSGMVTVSVTVSFHRHTAARVGRESTNIHLAREATYSEIRFFSSPLSSAEWISYFFLPFATPRSARPRDCPTHSRAVRKLDLLERLLNLTATAPTSFFLPPPPLPLRQSQINCGIPSTV